MSLKHDVAAFDAMCAARPLTPPRMPAHASISAAARALARDIHTGVLREREAFAPHEAKRAYRDAPALSEAEADVIVTLRGKL